jgi:hypothetical protein
MNVAFVSISGAIEAAWALNFFFRGNPSTQNHQKGPVCG